MDVVNATGQGNTNVRVFTLLLKWFS